MSVKVLSLFDGMACGYLAMLAADIQIEQYDAYEIDENAVKLSSYNFPDIKHHGDVFAGDFTQYEGYDYLIGGSPCTYWSIAQSASKRERDPSGLGWDLFAQYLRALSEAKPRFFIYENNASMSPNIKKEISRRFGFGPVLINSALVSAQNRERLYWVGKRTPNGDYLPCPVSQPEDRGIMLKDVLDSAIPINDTDSGKSRALRAAYSQVGALNLIDPEIGQRQTGGAVLLNTVNGGKSGCLLANDCKMGIRDILAAPKNFLKTGVAHPIYVGDRGNVCAQSTRLYSPEGKSVTLCGSAGGGGAQTGLYTIPSDQVKNVYEVKGGTLDYKGKKCPVKLKDGLYEIRKLTVSECKRLQTVPDTYDMSVISNTQAYRCLGNGWTVEVIAHLIRATQKSNRTGQTRIDTY